MTLERYLHVYHHVHGLGYAVARVSNPFGPHQRHGTGQGVVAALLHCAITRSPFTISGDGSVVRDYFHVHDLVEALVRLAQHEGAEQVFNIGSGVGTSLNAMVELVEAATARPIECIYRPGRAIDAPVNVLDIGRAGRELGWRAETPLEVGLAQTFDWMVQRHQL